MRCDFYPLLSGPKFLVVFLSKWTNEPFAKIIKTSACPHWENGFTLLKPIIIVPSNYQIFVTGTSITVGKVHNSDGKKQINTLCNDSKAHTEKLCTAITNKLLSTYTFAAAYSSLCSILTQR